MKIQLSENQLMTVKKYVINEDVKLAEKILRATGYQPTDEWYVDLKNDLLKNNKLGYIGIILKLSAMSDGRLSKRWVYRLTEFFKEESDILKFLPKNVFQYDNYDIFLKDADITKFRMVFKKLLNKLTSDVIKGEIKEYMYGPEVEDRSRHTRDVIDIINNMFNLPSSSQKEFFTISDKFKSFDELMIEMSAFVKNYIGTFDGMMDKIKTVGDEHLRVLMSDENLGHILVRVLDYKGSESIGSTSWCIVSSKDQFESYVGNNNYQYFFFNFGVGIPAKLKMLAFTMDPNGEISYSHDRYNSQFENTVKYLKSIGVNDKILKINYRERAIRTLDRFSKTNDRLHNSNYEYENINIESNFTYSLEILGTILSMIQNEYYVNNNIDILAKHLESFPAYVKVQEKDENGIYHSKTIKSTINGFQYVSSKFDYHEKDEYRQINNHSRDWSIMFGKEMKKKVIDFFIKVYNSNFKKNEITNYSILGYLKNQGYNTDEMVYNKKIKSGEDLSDTIFSATAKSGKNLKPIIQNKMSSLRRGEDVNLSYSETMYAIENGFEPFIKKYYTNGLNNYLNYRLDYDDMRIYQKLGMIKDITDVIIKKGDMYGINTLNSIETSMYQMANNVSKVK
jgi:hypothetical protein